MSITMKSTLNPLADSFIPSSCLKMLSKDEGPSGLKEKKSMNVQKDLTSAMNVGIKDEMKLELSFSKKSMIETFLSGRTSLLPNLVKNFLAFSQVHERESKLSLQKSKFWVWQEERNDSKEPICVETTESSQAKEVKEKGQCCCPPMFGWVVPPEFFGNPFNLKYDCSKRHAHISETDAECKDSLVAQDELSNLTLDELYLEFEEILADIFECVSDYPGPTDNEEEKLLDDEMDSGIETKRQSLDSGIETKRQSLDSGIETKRQSLDSDYQELDLVDDGCHPLLELETLTVSEYDDEDKESTARIEEILEHVLTPPDQRCSKILTSHRTVCNPPCSVWCDSVPTAAVSTYRKFITELDSTKHKYDHEPLYLGRPIYKRSFSENDSLKYDQFDANLSRVTSAKERLSMLQKSQSYVLDRKKCSLSNSFLKKSSKDDSNTWGPFDGADSLWQPLPDCVSSNEHNLKQSSYRRARDMRRQKSVN